MDRLFSRINDTIYATIYGTLAVSSVQGVLGGLMFWWLGLSAPLLWGVVMALLAVVPVSVVFYFSICGIVAGGLTLLSTGAHSHSAGGVALLLAIGLLATAGQMMMTRAYGIGRPLSNASLQYMGIAFSFGYGVLIFDDPVTWLALGGMALIVLAGLAATMFGVRQALAKPLAANAP